MRAVRQGTNQYYDRLLNQLAFLHVTLSSIALAKVD